MRKNVFAGSMLLLACVALVACTTDSGEEVQYVKIGQNLCSFLAEGNQPLEIDVKASPAEWTVEAGATWVKAERTDGRTLTVTVDDNNTGAERSTTISIAADQASQEIRVNQLAKDNEFARYRKLDYLSKSGAMSPSGRYVGGYVATVGDDDVWLKSPTIIDLETDEVYEFGPYPETLYFMTQTICISDQGLLFIKDGNQGGMFVCADDADAAAAPGIRHNGCCAYPADRERYWSPAMSCVDSFLDDRWPQNFCLGEAQCALGSEQLKSVIANNEILIEQDRKIREWLKDVPEITFPGIVEGGRYVVHQYIMHYDGSKYGKNRNDLLDLLTQKYGVRAIVQYYPLYRYPLFQKKGCGAYDCPVLDAWWDNSFSFPWWCGIDDESMRIMCEGLIHAVKDLRG